MNEKIKSLLQNFIFGGGFIALVSYVGTYLNPVEGAILWSYPFSLLPTLYFMKNAGKSSDYITKFTIVGTFAIILEAVATFALAYFMKTNKSSADFLNIAILKSIGLWLVLGLIYYKAVYYFNIQKKFM
jgi:hypothetical protein